MDLLQIANIPSRDCHNCRPRRLRCDRSVPSCRKCTSSGQACLGYGKRYRFAGAVASRGKLAGKKIPVLEPAGGGASNEPAEKPEPTASNGQSQYRPMNAAVITGDRLLCPTSIPGAMVDPLFEGAGHTYRHYLSYYTTRLCQDLMAVDLPDNPFRRLIVFSKEHPVLQHVLVASSAAHMANSLKSPVASRLSNGAIITKYSDTELSHRAGIDALVAKQKALQLMFEALQDIEAVGSDIVLIAVLFFINLECIESGKHGWKAHIEGSGRLLGHLPPPSALDETARDCIISDCYMYCIFASVFSREPLGLASYSFEMSSVMRVVVNSSLFCCPAEIMQLLLAAARLSNEAPEDGESRSRITRGGMDLLVRATSFDLDGWANDVKGLTPGRQGTEVSSRKHAAAAYQLACCLYIMSAVPSIAGMLPPGAEEAWEHDLTCHLSGIADDDPNFKTTLWPTFIAGAQARHPDQQSWVMERIRRILIYLPWGFLYAATDALQVIWTMRAESQAQFSWLQVLKDPRINFLLV